MFGFGGVSGDGIWGCCPQAPWLGDGMPPPASPSIWCYLWGVWGGLVLVGGLGVANVGRLLLSDWFLPQLSGTQMSSNLLTSGDTRLR